MSALDRFIVDSGSSENQLVVGMLCTVCRKNLAPLLPREERHFEGQRGWVKVTLALLVRTAQHHRCHEEASP